MDAPPLRFTPVRDAAAVATVAALAAKIWREHYPAIIGAGQVEYMIERFQSAAAMEAQIREQGYRYFLVEDGDGPAGYLAAAVRGEELFLSKFYLTAACRGRGYARPMMGFVEDLARAAGCRALTLTVNKRNAVAIRAYERLGFVIEKEIVIDIGGGYVMDDYAMARRVDQPA